MKKLIICFGAIVLMFGFTQCKSVKFDKNPPFSIESVTYSNLPVSKGTRVEIYLSNKIDIAFESLFFQYKKTKIEIREKNGKTILTAYYNTSKILNDMVLESDSKKEIVNKVDEHFFLKKNYPFELKENEAVISFKEDGKVKYVKIENIKKTKPDLYPQMKH